MSSTFPWANTTFERRDSMVAKCVKILYNTYLSEEDKSYFQI